MSLFMDIRSGCGEGREATGREVRFGRILVLSAFEDDESNCICLPGLGKNEATIRPAA